MGGGGEYGGGGWRGSAKRLDLMIKVYDWRGVWSIFALGGPLGLGFLGRGSANVALIREYKQKGCAGPVPQFFFRKLRV